MDVIDSLNPAAWPEPPQMSYFNGTGAVTPPLRTPAILADLPFTTSVFQSQGLIVDRNRLVSVFLRDPTPTFTRVPTASGRCVCFQL